MTKADLIAAVQAEVGDTVASKAVVGKILDGLSSVIAHGLAQGETVPLNDIGRFSPVKREARKGRNPNTGEPIDIPACNAVKFVCSKTLKDALN